MKLANRFARISAKIRKHCYNPLEKAYERLIENPYINYENGEVLVLSDILTEKDEHRFYRTSARESRRTESGDILCHAFWEGFSCWHCATLAIIENYFCLKTVLTRKTKTVAGMDGKVSPMRTISGVA